MGASCCGGSSKPSVDLVYRRVLWAAMLVNAGMFLVEIVAGVAAGSVSLKADALDFLADAANYAISLFVLGAVLAVRAKAALLKGLSLGAIGLFVAGNALHNAVVQQVPQAEVMGVVGLLALAVNVGVAVLLYAYRQGDANMRSVWICSRNDAIGNVAVVLAAVGVFGMGTGWPDIVVAGVMAYLSLSGAVQIVRQAWGELGLSDNASPAAVAPAVMSLPRRAGKRSAPSACRVQCRSRRQPAIRLQRMCLRSETHVFVRRHLSRPGA